MSEEETSWPGPEVDLLCLDAGSTFIYQDHARIAACLGRAGFEVAAEVVARAEDSAMRALFRGEARRPMEWSHAENAVVRSWGVLMATEIAHAGAPAAQARPLLEALWDEHRTFPFWSRVADGLVEAVEEVQAEGVRVAVVSNSEGNLEGLLARLGILGVFDRVFDSGVVGIEKPDPRIFQKALDAAGVRGSHAVHLGDSPADVGALDAGIRVALVDPHGRLDGLYPSVPRVAGFREVARQIVRARRR